MSGKRYTDESKSEAVKQVTGQGHSVTDLVQRLGITSHGLYAWKLKFGRPDMVRQAELGPSVDVRRLKAELKRMTEERDILKKAFMPKPDAATARRNLAISFEHYNEKYPHSALKYRSSREFRLPMDSATLVCAVTGITGEGGLQADHPTPLTRASQQSLLNLKLGARCSFALASR